MHTTERFGIRAGTRVYASDGVRVGTVTQANSGYIVVGQGVVFPTDYFIPTIAIARVAGKRAELNVSTSEALMSGWDRGQSIPR